MKPLPQFVTHNASLGSLKSRHAAGNEGGFSDEEQAVPSFPDAVVQKQLWRTHSGSLARVVVFLSDGAHIVSRLPSLRSQAGRNAAVPKLASHDGAGAHADWRSMSCTA